MLQSNEICYIVYSTLRESTVYMQIKLDSLVYPNLYYELADNIVAFCDDNVTRVM